MRLAGIGIPTGKVGNAGWRMAVDPLTATTGSDMTVQDIDTFVAAWERWHDEHDDTLGDPHGFLAITHLHYLSGEPTRLADAPGAWSTASTV